MERRSFSNLVYLHNYEQKISFFHDKPGFLTIVWLLLHFSYIALECQLRMSKEKGSYKNWMVVDRIQIFDFFYGSHESISPLPDAIGRTSVEKLHLEPCEIKHQQVDGCFYKTYVFGCFYCLIP